EEWLVFLEHPVLDDYRRYPPGAGVHDLQDLSQMPDRMRDRQHPSEVLVLHVDHQQRPFHQHLPTRDLIVTATLVDLDLILILPDRLRFRGHHTQFSEVGYGVTGIPSGVPRNL